MTSSIPSPQSILALIASGDRVTPIFRKTGTIMLGADAFSRAEDIEQAVYRELPGLLEQLDVARVALDRGAADYVGLLEQLEEHHRVGYGLNWGEKCPICGPCRSLSEPGSREAEGQAHGSVKGSRVGTGSERERQ